MQIECPACAVRYDVPDEVVRPGRAMRCARCGETWTPREIEPEAVPAAAALDMRPAAALSDGEDWAEAGVDAPAADAPGTPAARVPLLPAPARRGGVVLAAAWIASAIVLLAAIWAAWHFHQRIERSWPPSARLFALFGRRHT